MEELEADDPLHLKLLMGRRTQCRASGLHTRTMRRFFSFPAQQAKNGQHNCSNTLIAGLKACNSASPESIVLYSTALLLRLPLPTTRMITAVTSITQHKKHVRYRADKKKRTLYKTLLCRLPESFSASILQQTGPTRTGYKVHSRTSPISCQLCVRTTLEKRWVCVPFPPQQLQN